MSLPVLAKTWQYDVNQTITGFLTAGDFAKAGMLALKNSFIGFALNPWTVQDSGNTITQGGDTWNSIADLVPGTGGSGSWIRLRQTGIAPQFEIIIGMDNNSGVDQRGYIMASYTGFTGGTPDASTRPTATDEFAIGTSYPHPLNNQVANWFSTQISQHRLHVWQSTDGEATYWQFYQSDVAENGGTIQKPLFPTTGFTQPHLASAAYATNPGLGYLASSLEAYCFIAPQRQNGGYTTEARMNGQPLYTDAGGQLSTLDNSYILSPVGFYLGTSFGFTNTEHGRMGSLVDAWVTSQTLGDVTTFPSNGSRQFVMFKGNPSNMVLPWNGSVIETA